MSAFIVSPVSVQKIAGYILRDDFWKRRLAEEFPESSADWLAQSLHTMNCKAVDERYHETNEPSAVGYVRTAPEENIQTFKRMKCYLYQCSEGNVPEEPLFKFVERVMLGLASNIIRNLPAYDSAEWG